MTTAIRVVRQGDTPRCERPLELLALSEARHLVSQILDARCDPASRREITANGGPKGHAISVVMKKLNSDLMRLQIARVLYRNASKTARRQRRTSLQARREADSLLPHQRWLARLQPESRRIGILIKCSAHSPERAVLEAPDYCLPFVHSKARPPLHMAVAALALLGFSSAEIRRELGVKDKALLRRMLRPFASRDIAAVHRRTELDCGPEVRVHRCASATFDG